MLEQRAVHPGSPLTLHSLLSSLPRSFTLPVTLGLIQLLSFTDPVRFGDLPEVTRWLSGREGTGTQLSSLPAQRLSLSILKSASARKPWLPTLWA